jgi:glycosyltransferase involved in cell wall biosynthesis
VVVDGTDLDGMFDRYVDVDVAVVPTLWSEGTSLAAVEAICAGVPVVATAVGGLGNLVVPEFNGVIVRPEAAAIAAAVRAYQDEDRWRAHRRNCLSMRGAWSLERWEAGALAWLAS